MGPDTKTRIQIINSLACANALVSFIESFARQKRGAAEHEIQERITECAERQDFDLARAMLLYRYFAKKVENLA